MSSAPFGSNVEAVSSMLVASADLMWRHLADRKGLSASATLVLVRLNREGPMRVTALAEAEGASQSGMTQLVQRLEQQGLLERCSDPDDGRACLVKVSEGAENCGKSGPFFASNASPNCWRACRMTTR